jgi:hypothetical protein
MQFQIPAHLAQFSVAGLKDLIKQAKDEYSAMKEEVSPETVTDEQLDELEALRNFWKTDGPTELAGRVERSARYSTLDEESEEEAETEETEVEEPEAEAEVEEVEELETVTASSKPPKPSTLNAKGAGSKLPKQNPWAPGYASLVAAAGVPNYEAGSKFTTMLDVAKAFEARSAGHGRLNGGPTGTGPISYPVAQLVRNYPDEYSVFGDETDYNKIQNVANEERLPGGSLIRSVEQRFKQLQAEEPARDALVAAAGWCAPSETDYSICLQITTDGLLDAPEVQARRGGIRHNTGIEFDSIFGSGTGFFNLTEAQVASGTTKTCLEIPCPSFVDTRLGVTGVCLTGNILSIRGYPEFTAAFTKGSMAASAHQVNREQIAAIIADSTAVNLTAAQPWASDGTVLSQVMSAVEMAAVDIKYRLRLMQNSTLEVIFPYWLLAQFRADWIRRTGGCCDWNLQDSEIMAGFTTRGVRPQFVYDWQDAFATGAASGSPGADTPINNLPTSLSFIMYPSGTWVRAVSDVITLNSVYDSTKLATNQVTHLFTETGWAMVRNCPVSRVYTVGVCPSGATSATHSITCPS